VPFTFTNNADIRTGFAMYPNKIRLIPIALNPSDKTSPVWSSDKTERYTIRTKVASSLAILNPLPP
jgi:hypothetical protein